MRGASALRELTDMVHKEEPLEVEAAPKQPFAGRNMAASVDYLVGSLLEDRHYNKVSSLLRGKWDRCQSLHAATKLLEKHGVELSEEEEQQLLSVGEDKMIEALVCKMPPQSKEQFQDFFLQLQAVVGTATSVRAGLREGRPDLVEAALEQAEGTGVAQHILKMAIVQAGSEVANLKAAHANWVKDSQAKMSKLLRGQEDKREAQKKLAAARHVLHCHQEQHSERAKKVLMGFAAGSAKTLVKTTFLAWAQESGQLRREGDLEDEHRQRMKRAEKMYFDAKVRQLENVRSVMTGKAREQDRMLLAECWAAFRQEMVEGQQDGMTNAQVRELETKLASLASESAQRAKGLMQRVSLCMDSDLLATCVQVWAGEVKLLAREKEFEDQVEAAKERIDRLKEERKSNTKSMLDKMARDIDSGLLYQCLSSWQQFVQEEKRGNEMAESLCAMDNRLRDMHGWHKSQAETVTERASDQMDLLLLLSIFCNWRLHTRMEDILRQQGGRIESKKTQLVKVQGMFKTFAQELEANFKNSSLESDTDWHLSPHQRGRQRKELTKSEGTFSLPSIHAKQPVPGGTPKALSRSPKALDSRGYPVEDFRMGDLSNHRQAWH